MMGKFGLSDSWTSLHFTDKRQPNSLYVQVKRQGIIQ